MKKEIEVKFTLKKEDLAVFKKWLKTNAQFQCVEQHEEIYLNNSTCSFFFDHKQGFKDAYTTIRLRSKAIITVFGTGHNDLFCSKFSHVNQHNEIVSRDEFEINLSADDACSKFNQWTDKFNQWTHEKCNLQPLLLLSMTKENVLSLFERCGFTERFELTKDRKIYRFGDFEIVLDTLPNIGSFIEIELKFDEHNITKGRSEIYEFLKTTGITHFVQYNRSYLHMKVNQGYNFGQEMNLERTFSNNKE